MPQRAAGYVELTFKAYREGDQYVSECVELGVASCGDTLDEAFENIKEATEVYLSTLDDIDELERVFAERRVTIHPGEPPGSAPQQAPEVLVRVRVREFVSPTFVRLPVPV